MLNGPFISRFLVALLTVLGSAGLLYFQRAVNTQLGDRELGIGLAIVMALSTLLGYLTSLLSDDSAKVAASPDAQPRMDELRTSLVRSSTQLITLANFAKLTGTNEPLSHTLQGAIRMIAREFFVPKLCLFIVDPDLGSPKLSEHMGYSPEEVNVLETCVEESLVDWVIRKRLVYSEFESAVIMRPGSGVRRVAPGSDQDAVPLVGDPEGSQERNTSDLETEHPELQATRRVNKIPTVYCIPLTVGSDIVGVLNFSAIEPGKTDEFRETSRFLCLLGSLIALRIQSGLTVERVQSLAVKDNVTGLFTWEHAEAALDAEVMRGRRYEFPVGLLLVELQEIDDVTKESGDAAVKRVMAGVAETLTATRRGVDVPFRFSASHSGLILPHTGPEGLMSVAQRVNNEISRKVFTGTRGEILLVGFSIGVACFPDHADSAGTLMQAALQGLDTARSAGKNHIALHRGDDVEPIIV
jgi:diguanylate cyclase (GGDEF)-like protein